MREFGQFRRIAAFVLLLFLAALFVAMLVPGSEEPRRPGVRGMIPDREASAETPSETKRDAAPDAKDPAGKPGNDSPAPPKRTPAGREREMLADLDRRKPRGEIPSAAQRAALEELRRRVPGVDVRFDTLTGAPAHILATGRLLSPPSPVADPANGDFYAPVRRFIEENAGLFGHGAALQEARIVREDVTAHNGMRTVVWQQQVDGVPLYKTVLRASLTKDGKLITLGSHFLAAPDAATGLEPAARAALLAQPPLDAAQAVTLAAADVGDRIAPADVRSASAPDGAERRQRIQAPGLSDTNAGLTWLPLDSGSLRLAWDVTLMSLKRGAMFRVVVDAKTGAVLVRSSLTNDISDATYRVYANGTNLKPLDSPSPLSPGTATPGSTQPPEVARSLVTLQALDTTASPNGWIDDGGMETLGNNVDAHTDTNADNVADLPRPNGGAGRVFDFTLDLAQAPATYRDAAVTQLFYLCNWYHDRLYSLGFTESAGNFQQNNFGRGGLGNDAVQADAQDGSGTDNANFSTPPDGSPGRMQMYVFSGPTPDRDGDFDAEIVLHEYTHGLSNRLVGGGVGIGALQSAGMGEGWSDFYGLALLSEVGDDVNGNYAAGAYATYQLAGLTSNYYYGIRRYPYSTDLTKNPLTLKDIDPGQASSHPGIPTSPIFGGGNPAEVHSQGEVWCVTLWEVRANLINKHGWAVGNELVLQLVTDGMKLSPVNPTFLEARDAIVQADLVNNAGANQNEIWAGFARRGMGASASVPASTTTSGVTESFDLPDDLSVTPSAEVVASGPVGGPFTPPSQVFTLINTDASTPLYWTAASPQPWLSVVPAGGSLAPGASATVTAVFNNAANALAAGSHTTAITFTNTTSGAVLARSVRLVVGGVDYFTEFFDASLNDTDNQSWLFTPDASPNFYSVLRTTAAAFPTDPAGGTTLGMTDDSSVQVIPGGGAQVSLYGTSYSSFHVGSNGYITFGAADTSYSASLAEHFSKPRVAVLFTDLDPTMLGLISWRQLADRVAVTWQTVPEYGTANSNNFQIELFFDGRIRITCLGIAATRGLIGLSQGAGQPADFVESDFSAYGSTAGPALALSLPGPVTEGDGVLSGQGTVSISAPLASDLTVALASSNTAEITVPATAVISAGMLSATFDVTVADDALLDGTQDAVIAATAAGFTAAVSVVSVQDDETATLSVTAPATVLEGATGVQGTVTVSAPPGRAVAVSLASSDTTELLVPASVVVPAGLSSATFPITVVDDNVIDGTQPATITAHVANWTGGMASVSVEDNEASTLAVLAPLQAVEGGTYGGTISAPGIVTSPLLVSLVSDNTARLTVPPNVTIPAGSSSVPFTITTPDNALTDGTAFATITATAAGFTTGNLTIDVFDDDVHHFTVSAIASPQIRGVPFGVTIAAKDVNGVTIASYAGAPSLSATGTAGAVAISPATASGFVNGIWTGAVTAGTLSTAVVLTVDDGAGHAGTSNAFDVDLGALHHFEWDTVAGPKTAGTPFSVTISAKDAGGNTLPSFTGATNLSGFVSMASGSSIVITEANPNSPDEVEFMNVSTAPVNMSGWTVSIYDFNTYPGANTFTIPDGSICGPGQVFRLQEFGSPPGAFPLFFLGANINWTSDAGSPIAVLLQNNAGQLVDFFCAGAGSPTAITSPVTIPSSQWSGPTVPAPGNISHGYSRVGSLDQNSAADWLTASPGMGAANPGLATPFTITTSVPISPTTSGSFVNGMWSGQITVSQEVTQMVLRADNGSGTTGDSNAFDVIGTLVGNPQMVSVPYRTPKAIVLTGTDTANPGAVLSFAIAAEPEHGALTGTPPNLVYTPTGGYYGSDSFTFTVSDGATLSAPATVSVTVLGPPVIAGFTLDSDPGWQRQGQWAFGVPAGGGGTSYGRPDPAAGATGANVIGVNLNGDYSTEVGGPYYLTAGPFNLMNHSGTLLRFQRWLNTDYQPYVSATIEVSNDGVNWTMVWQNGSTRDIADSAWTRVEYDISAVADNKAAVFVRWGYSVSSGAYAYSGWNLDDIELLAIPPLVVTTNIDENDGALGLGAGDSLRECIAAAKSNGAFIVFAPALGGQTILLGSPLLIDKALTLDGSTISTGVTIDGNANTRILEIQPAAIVTLESLGLARGKSNASGGAVSNAGSLTLSRCSVSQSLAFSAGGGVWNTGTLTAENSTFADNFAGTDGGGISSSGTVVIRHCTVSGNTAFFGTGSGIQTSGTLTLENSAIAGNSPLPVPNVAGTIQSSLGVNFTSGNPRLAPLNPYGGRTRTMPPLPGSPLIEAAALLVSTPATDQRGGPRPSGPHPDIGAVEAFAFSSIALIDTDGDGVDDRLEPAFGLVVGVNESTVDSDGDGFTDASEIASMTDPLDPASRLRIVSFTPAAGFDPVTNPVFDVTFTCFPGLSYSVELQQELNFAAPGLQVIPAGQIDGFTRTMQIQLLPGHDFLRLKRN